MRRHDGMTVRNDPGDLGDVFLVTGGLKSPADQRDQTCVDLAGSAAAGGARTT